MSAEFVLLSWRVAMGGRHVPPSSEWGKTLVHDPSRCLDDARSLHALGGCSQITLILSSGNVDASTRARDGQPQLQPVAWSWAPAASWVRR